MGILEQMRTHLRDRSRDRRDRRDPGERAELPVEFGDLPVGAGALQALLTECAECHSLVLRTSVAEHRADHQRWAVEILTMQVYDGPLLQPPPLGQASGGQTGVDSPT